MIKTITSFTSHKTGEGTRLSATYSVINEDGQIVKSNERFNLVVVDDEIQEAIDLINGFLNTKIPTE
ncbi:MAG: peptide chain release factor 2 [Clostridiales bacterium]|nr:peptide chain release factor 2 [Clostridiales bacterium]